MKIRIATPDDIPALENLRVTAYQSATGSKTPDLSFLHWDEFDEQSINLVIEDETKQIISSMRGNVIETKKRLEALFDITVNASFPFPVFTMGRAATFLEHRNLGYNALLRLLFLRACLNPNIQGIASTIQADASRVAMLRKMDYKIEEANISHRINSSFHNTSKTYFNRLPKKQISDAIAIAEKNTVTPLSVFELQKGIVTVMKRRIDQLCLTQAAIAD